MREADRGYTAQVYLCLLMITSIIAGTWRGFRESEITKLAAAFAYYGLLALPAVLLVLWYGSFLFPYGQMVFDTVLGQLSGVAGEQATAALSQAIEGKRLNTDGNVAGLVIGIALLLLSLLGLFGQLQWGIHRTWGVAEGYVHAPWYSTWGKRAMGIVILALMIVGVAASLAFAGLQEWFVTEYALRIPQWVLSLINLSVSWLVMGLLIGLTFWQVPQFVLSWRLAFLGGMITSALLLLGMSVIGQVIGTGGGLAAGFLALLSFVYYLGLIFFVGAEITQQIAQQTGQQFEANEYVTFPKRVRVIHLSSLEKAQVVAQTLWTQTKIGWKLYRWKSRRNK